MQSAPTVLLFVAAVWSAKALQVEVSHWKQVAVAPVVVVKSASQAESVRPEVVVFPSAQPIATADPLVT
jgi:hypothetical protein